MMGFGKHSATLMSESGPPDFGINSWLEDELYQQYLHDRKTVDESWKKVFESNGGAAPAGGNGSHTAIANGVPARATQPSNPQYHPASGEQLVPLRGAAARIAD